jgi:hypothetical protein
MIDPRKIQEQLNQATERDRNLAWGLCDKDWEYVPAAATDVTKTWRKFGWTPINEKEKENE